MKEQEIINKIENVREFIYRIENIDGATKQFNEKDFINFMALIYKENVGRSLPENYKNLYDMVAYVEIYCDNLYLTILK